MLYIAIDSVTNKHLDNTAKTMFPKWQETKDYIYDMYYVLSDAEKMPSMRCASCYTCVNFAIYVAMYT